MRKKARTPRKNGARESRSHKIHSGSWGRGRRESAHPPGLRDGFSRVVRGSGTPRQRFLNGVPIIDHGDDGGDEEKGEEAKEAKVVQLALPAGDRDHARRWARRRCGHWAWAWAGAWAEKRQIAALAESRLAAGAAVGGLRPTVIILTAAAPTGTGGVGGRGAALVRDSHGHQR